MSFKRFLNTLISSITLRNTSKGLGKTGGAFRKALTPKRLELLRLIRKHHPKTLHALSRLAGRDTKNISQDLRLLENLGLVSIRKEKTGRKEVTPSVDYDAIELMIAV